MNASVENSNQAGAVQQPENGEDKSMKADDSNLVDEVLAELNQDSGEPSEGAQNDVASMTGSEHGQQAPVNPGNDMMDMVPDMEIPPQMDVEYDSEENTENTWMKRLKKPLIVLVLCFIMFNPSVRTLLSTHLPRVFGSSSSMLLQQGQVLLLSTLVAVLFFGTNLLD